MISREEEIRRALIKHADRMREARLREEARQERESRREYQARVIALHELSKRLGR